MLANTKQLTEFLEVLHDRGIVNEIALQAVLKDLVDGKPLTLDQLAGIFGVEPIYHLVATPSHDADRSLLRSQLAAITEALHTPTETLRGDVDGLIAQQLQLVAILTEELCQRPRWWPSARRTPPGLVPVLLQLLREAFEAFNNPESKIDLRDWTKEARKVLRADRSESET